MKVKFAAILFILSFLAQSGFCGDLNRARELFSRGNTAYSRESFDEAIDAYGRALKTGMESAALYYNLGNACFKRGFLGKAILNYLRADKLMPRDVDLKSNLRYARSLIKDAGRIPSKNRIMRGFFSLSDTFTLDESAVCSTVLYFLLSGLIIFSIMGKTGKKNIFCGIVITSVLWMLFSAMAVEHFFKDVIQTRAVVTVEQTNVCFEPLAEATTFFSLNEGDDICVIALKKEWAKIRRGDGKQGWVKRSDLDFI